MEVKWSKILCFGGFKFCEVQYTVDFQASLSKVRSLEKVDFSLDRVLGIWIQS